MPPIPIPLIAFGFGSLSMLGWLAAAAAPIVIHLWSRRRYREAPWAAVDFLLAAVRKNARRIRLQQWLLLALRTLILALVAFAVAEPHFEQFGFPAQEDVRVHKLFILDGSYSMGYKPAEKTLFGRAKELTAQIVEQSGQGDGFTLVLMSDPPRAVVRQPAFSASEFLSVVEAQTLPHAGGDVTATLDIAMEILHRVQADDPALEKHEVYLLTDLGRSTWQPAQSAARSTALHDSLLGLTNKANVVVLDLGQDDCPNLAVTRFATIRPYVVAGRDFTVEAVVRNFGPRPRSQCLLQLAVAEAFDRNGGLSPRGSPANPVSPVEDRRIDVPAGGETAISFTHRFDEPGRQVVSIRLGADLLAIDDRRWLTVDVKPHLRALCVEGRRGAAGYVAKALAPSPELDEFIRPDIISESALLELDLDNYDCIFFCNISQFTSGEAAVLDNYLRHGGGVVFFLGDQVVPDRYNRELASINASESNRSDRSRLDVDFLPVQIEALVSEAVYGFDPLGYRHPIVEPFRGQESAGLLTTPVYRYFRLELREDKPQAEVALAFAANRNWIDNQRSADDEKPPNGDPVIVVAPAHRGRVAVVATAASLASVDPITKEPWTAWPAWPSFLPLVRGILLSVISGQQSEFNVRVGEPIGQVLPSNSGSGSIRVTRPDGTTHIVRTKTGLSGVGWVFDATDESGIYRTVGVGASGDSNSIPFAVNLDTAESDLAKLPASVLPSQLTILQTWQGTNATAPEEIVSHYRVHRGLLVAAFFCLVGESFFAWRLGRGAA